MLFADERIYFLTRRTPPPGMEWRGTRKIDLPMAEAVAAHVLPEAERIRLVRMGAVDTFETCSPVDLVSFQPDPVYREKFEMNGCFAYWGPRSRSAESRSVPKVSSGQ